MKISEFQLERYLALHEFSAPFLLCTSDSETMTIRELLSLKPGADEEFNNLGLGYTESQGIPALRKEIANLYTSLNSDQIVVSAGAEEAIFLLMNILLSPGDHVIVQAPAYQSLYEVANAIGCAVSRWELKENGSGWVSDIEELKRLIRPDTKAIVVNSPHNPTGHLFTHGEWNDLNKIIRETSIRLISDEVYRGLEHARELQLSAAADEHPRNISIGVMSKAFGLAGLRIGWIATHDKEVVRRFLAMKDYTTICSSAPSEFLATLALQNKDVILRKNLAIVHQNLHLLSDFFKKFSHVMTWSAPIAGSTAFPRIINGMSAQKFCDEVRENIGVLLLPGSVFGVDGSYVRFGYGRSDMHQSLNKLVQYLQEK